jgi:uncharacterized protein YajQ (UPF0234 family)
MDLNKKDFKISLETDDDMKMRQLCDVLMNRAHKQGIDPMAFDFFKRRLSKWKGLEKGSNREKRVATGRCKEDSKAGKDSGLKVQASINDDLVRIQGKKIDDLQAVIQLCKTSNLQFPLQYVNMRD